MCFSEDAQVASVSVSDGSFPLQELKPGSVCKMFQINVVAFCSDSEWGKKRRHETDSRPAVYGPPGLRVLT